MDFIKMWKKLSLVVALILLLTAFIQPVVAYHGHNAFYDDPNYYGRGSYYDRYPYYTHHQYHYVSYRYHYRQYNRYYYYPPPRYSRYRYYPCLPEYDCYHPWE